MFDPDQPRDRFGRWTDEGGTTTAIHAAAKTVPLNANDPEIIKKSMDQWFNEDLPKLEEGIDIRRWVNEYTTPFFRDLNYNLYNDNELTPEQKIADEKLGKLFEVAPKTEGTFYRGMNFSNEAKYKAFKRDLGEDGEIQFKGYMSTTLDREVTRRSKFQGDERIRHRVEFSIKGKNGVYIAGVSTVPDEQEVLFKRGVKLRVKKMYEKIDADNNVKLFVEAEEL